MPKNPLIYEINTWVWLYELSQKYGRHVTLSTVPVQEWDVLSQLGVDAIWLMGVWERSPAGIAIALENEAMVAEFRKVLPGFKPVDVAGSPYCVRRYVVDGHLGGTEGLEVARDVLHHLGLGLILDFVPNHVAPDHPWTTEHPGYFIRGDAADLQRDPASFYEVQGTIFARGRDPYYPGWPDVLQLNAFSDQYRRQVIKTITCIAGQCDGIRCDMAMLMMNDVFYRTWGARAGERPRDDFWTTVIPAVKKDHPEFIFIAEVYWDLEWALQQQGFDYCYDKRLYDRVVQDNAGNVRLHLTAALFFQEKLIRFIENHDEPRAAALFTADKERAAALVVLTLPGARLLHQGQFEGFRIRLPVFLQRRPVETPDLQLRSFYLRLIAAVHNDLFRIGRWLLCESTEENGHTDSQNILAWLWTFWPEHRLIVVNFSDKHAQARIRVPDEDLMGLTWHLTDVLSNEEIDANGNEMNNPGLYVDLEPWEGHLYRLKQP
jgi:glycosidase